MASRVTPMPRSAHSRIRVLAATECRKRDPFFEGKFLGYAVVADKAHNGTRGHIAQRVVDMARQDKTPRRAVTVVATNAGLLLLDPSKPGPKQNVHAAATLHNIAAISLHKTKSGKEKIMSFLFRRHNAEGHRTDMLDCHVVKLKSSKEAAKLYSDIRLACNQAKRDGLDARAQRKLLKQQSREDFLQHAANFRQTAL